MRISDVDLVENDPTAQALPSEAEVAREGFFGTQAANPVEGTVSSDTTLGQTATGAAPVVSEPAPQGGLFGLLRRAVPAQRPVAGGAEDTLSADAFEAAKSAEAVAAEPATQLAAVSPEPEAPASAPERRGFFARLGSKSAAKASESELPEVDYGTMLPYGVMARRCATQRQPLGRKPAASGTRIFYITGFDDGCPRQVTAAHVLLGEPSFYEQLHYGPAGQHLTFGETDRAYEKVKGSVCGVRKGKPCGAKMKKLEREALFINAYERLSDNKRWSEQLIHDGTVVASEMKSSG